MEAGQTLATAPRLVCFAVKEEARAFRTAAAQLPAVVTLVTGMGRRNTEDAVGAFLASRRPQFVITSGFAGALRSDLCTGTVLFEATPGTPLFERLCHSGALPGKYYCADRIATTAAEKNLLRQQTGADAVEMESGHIHAICRAREIASATVRVILDTAEENLPLDFNLLLKPDASMDMRKLALELARAPGKIPALLRLNRQTRNAARSLAEVLKRALD